VKTAAIRRRTHDNNGISSLSDNVYKTARLAHLYWTRTEWRHRPQPPAAVYRQFTRLIQTLLTNVAATAAAAADSASLYPADSRLAFPANNQLSTIDANI